MVKNMYVRFKWEGISRAKYSVVIKEKEIFKDLGTHLKTP